MLAKFKGKQIVFYFTKNLSEIEIYIHLLNVEDLGKTTEKIHKEYQNEIVGKWPRKSSMKIVVSWGRCLLI